eukprot:TRINITY_DN2913_c0_g1_i2.p1 TRINITY_DN2913_c0_g1~~TRINITY_DN2913_c0_g1_i2.p1  ORF type:complete len:423 (-),score=87.83 TRINITY_DN2913_c0_g1_i2:49-1317(-)
MKMIQDRKYSSSRVGSFQNKLLRDCCQTNNVDAAETVAKMIDQHRGMIWKDYQHLFDMCYRLKDVSRAETYFKQAKQNSQKFHDLTPMYNSLIQIYATKGDLYRINTMLLDVDHQKFTPNQLTFRTILDACQSFEQVDDTLMAMHALSFEMGLETQRSLIKAYFRVHRPDLSLDVYTHNIVPFIDYSDRSFIRTMLKSSTSVDDPKNLTIVQNLLETTKQRTALSGVLPAMTKTMAVPLLRYLGKFASPQLLHETWMRLLPYRPNLRMFESLLMSPQLTSRERVQSLSEIQILHPSFLPNKIHRLQRIAQSCHDARFAYQLIFLDESQRPSETDFISLIACIHHRDQTEVMLDAFGHLKRLHVPLSEKSVNALLEMCDRVFNERPPSHGNSIGRIMAWMTSRMAMTSSSMAPFSNLLSFDWI